MDNKIHLSLLPTPVVCLLAKYLKLFSHRVFHGKGHNPCGVRGRQRIDTKETLAFKTEFERLGQTATSVALCAFLFFNRFFNYYSFVCYILILVFFPLPTFCIDNEV